MTENSNPVNWPIFFLSCVTRILFWGSTIFIIYLCIDRGYSLTTLHVAFFTIGCALLMVEATLVVTGDALLTRKLSKSKRVTLHWILHSLGVAALIVGMATIIVNKNQGNRSHFTSTHGKVGLAGFVAAAVVAVAAIPTLFRKMVPQAINFGSFKRTHIYLGIIATILLWAGQITGFWTRWWRSSDLVTNLTLSAYVIGGFCLLIKPLYSTLRRSFH